MAVGSFPQDARTPEERRASLDPSLDDLLDTLAGVVAAGSLDVIPNVRDTTNAQLAAWGIYAFGGDYAIDSDAPYAREGGDDPDL